MQVGGRTFYRLQILLIIVFSAVAATSVHGLRNVRPDGPCDPGELVFVGFCNLCLCNSQGIPNQLCARSWCPVQTTLPPRNSNTVFNPKQTTHIKIIDYHPYGM